MVEGNKHTHTAYIELTFITLFGDFAKKLHHRIKQYSLLSEKYCFMYITPQNATRFELTIAKHYSRAIWTSFYRFWVHVIWVPKLRFENICLEQKFKFFVNYEKWLQQYRNFHYEAFKTLNSLVPEVH